MKETYLDYADYNIWANNKLIKDLSSIDDHLITSKVISSFSTIRDTVLHIWYAECGWLSRMNGSDWDTTLVTDFSGSNAMLYEAWQKTSLEFKNFIPTADLNKEIEISHKGRSYQIAIKDMIHTVCNHGSYHRGQIVTLLRQLGVGQISQTDYIEWKREIARINNH